MKLYKFARKMYFFLLYNFAKLLPIDGPNKFIIHENHPNFKSKLSLRKTTLLKILDKSFFPRKSDSPDYENVFLGKYLDRKHKFTRYILNDVSIVSKHGIIKFDNYLFVNGFLPNFAGRTDALFKNNTFTYSLGRKIETTDNVLVLTTSGGSVNYYHFLIDLVPKFLHAKDKFKLFDLVIINGPEALFLKQLIEIFEVKNILISDNKLEYVAKSATIYGSLSPVGNPTDYAIKLLRQHLLSLTIDELCRPKRIYVSRRFSEMRKVLNEMEVEELMMNYGFDIVYLERLSFLDQISLFKSTKHIVSPHGAGMANITFSKPGTKLLELFSSLHVEPCMSNIAALNSIDYHYLVFNSINSNHDFYIDIDRLNRFLIDNQFLNS